MRVALFAVFLICMSAFASSKSQPEYQDAVLVSFYTVTSGSSCSSSGNLKGEVDDSGNVRGSTSGDINCANVQTRRYIIKVGENIYELQYELSPGQKAGALASGGVSLFFVKKSVLADALPGTPIKVRSDGHGFFVRVGKRESRYAIVSAK